MKAHIIKPEYAELCQDCPYDCKQPGWQEILRCPKRGYEHPDLARIMEEAKANGTIEPYIPEGQKPEKLWTASQKSRVMQLVKSSCCNYARNPDECLLLDGFPCILETSMHLCCNYFRDCVLPLDKQLCDELTALETGGDTKRCAVCGKQFIPGSNRAKYCPICAKEIHRKQKNASARKIYISNPDK